MIYSEKNLWQKSQRLHHKKRGAATAGSCSVIYVPAHRLPLSTWSPHEQLAGIFDWLSGRTSRLYIFSLVLYSYMNEVSLRSDCSFSNALTAICLLDCFHKNIVFVQQENLLKKEKKSDKMLINNFFTCIVKLQYKVRNSTMKIEQ